MARTGGGLPSLAVKAFPGCPVDVDTVGRGTGPASTSSPFSLSVNTESWGLLTFSSHSYPTLGRLLPEPANGLEIVVIQRFAVKEERTLALFGVFGY